MLGFFYFPTSRQGKKPQNRITTKETPHRNVDFSTVTTIFLIATRKRAPVESFQDFLL